MAWQNPKTNWKAGDVPSSDDFNRIEGNIQHVKDEIDNVELNAENVVLESSKFLSDNVKGGMEELFTSVSNGKNSIASAITDMGQSANGSDTFQTLANKIKDISKDANAETSHVLSGKTFYQGGSKKTGTMPNRGAYSKTITTQGGQITIPSGYHNGSGIVKAQFANLTPENIRKGVNIGGVVGTYIGDGTGLLICDEPWEITIPYNGEITVERTIELDNIDIVGVLLKIPYSTPNVLAAALFNANSLEGVQLNVTNSSDTRVYSIQKLSSNKISFKAKRSGYGITCPVEYYILYLYK